MRFCIFLLAASLGLEAGDAILTREGPFWVQTETGSERAPATGRLRISSNENVILRGGPQPEVLYFVTKRLIAGSEEEARALFKRFGIRSARKGDITVLGKADVQMTVPRGLRETVIITKGGTVQVSDLDGSLECHSGGGRTQIERIGGDVMAATGGGEISLDSIQGTVRCISGGGPIRARVIRGQAVFESRGGEIDLQEIGGRVQAATAGGCIRVRRATAVAGVHCETAGGTIRLSSVTGTLRASTARGNIVAQLISGRRLEESLLSTHAGDITVFVPSDMGVTINAQNEGSGGLRSIISDFPGLVVKTNRSTAVAEGPINGGGPLLRLAASGGTIFIRKGH